MELKAKITDAGVIYLPIEIRESFGKHVKLIPNATAAILFPADCDLTLVKRSVEIILQDLTLRIEKLSSGAPRQKSTETKGK